MEHLRFKSCKADPDVWMRKAVNPSDNSDYWEYVLLYVDDVLCISHDPQSVIKNEIGKYWKKGRQLIMSRKWLIMTKITMAYYDNIRDGRARG